MSSDQTGGLDSQTTSQMDHLEAQTLGDVDNVPHSTYDDSILAGEDNVELPPASPQEHLDNIINSELNEELEEQADPFTLPSVASSVESNDQPSYGGYLIENESIDNNATVEDSTAIPGGFYRDLHSSAAFLHHTLEQEEKNLIELKKVHEQSIKVVTKHFTTLEKKISAQLSAIDRQAEHIREQERRADTLLTTQYDQQAPPSPVRQQHESSPASKKRAISYNEPTQTRVPTTRSESQDHQPPSKKPSKGRPVKPKTPTRVVVPTTYEKGDDLNSIAEYLYPGRWDVARCGQFATISNEGRVVKTTGNGWNVVIGREPADRFSVKISFPTTKQKNSVAIGFTQETAFWKVPVQNPHSIFMFNEHGWFLNVRRGALCSKLGHDNDPYCAPFKTGDVLTVVLDRAANSISFYKNRKHMGIAYTNVLETDLFPAMATYDRGLKIALQ
ncbi:hypothetical protein LEN26_005696 [Aphanomyces euteiches]|nr:hypothetical protein AeMF1_000293 [Aphanomyces euteiches]KAH9137551.1 hypothetical protein LEN26_005696 [Aphanomyces euteiches]KAH9196863.1 hypothetical protein AeNC1_001177 [Aphanomyces euteiches]